MAKVGRKWEKEIYRISNLRDTDILRFKRRDDAALLDETADKFYMTFLSGKKVGRSKEELRWAKENLRRDGKICRAKGLEPILYFGVKRYYITVERDGQIFTFDEICLAKK